MLDRATRGFRRLQELRRLKPAIFLTGFPSAVCILVVVSVSFPISGVVSFFFSILRLCGCSVAAAGPPRVFSFLFVLGVLCVVSPL